MPTDTRVIGSYVIKLQSDGSFDIWRVFIASDTGRPWFYFVSDDQSHPFCRDLINRAFPQ